MYASAGHCRTAAQDCGSWVLFDGKERGLPRLPQPRGSIDITINQYYEYDDDDDIIIIIIISVIIYYYYY